jgi:deazaflavin-dependent oxidoreductase (nitroreductase family)
VRPTPPPTTLGAVQIRLITTGRRSGEPREATLYAWPDGDGLVVVGSRAGAARDPGWVHNLRANPRAAIRHGTRERPVTAVEVDDADRDRLWRMVVGAFPMYERYQQRTRRRIPLFVLNPADDR